MSVYVDQLQSCRPNKNWRWNKACHLFADDVKDLHAFAKQIGLKQAWFQSALRGTASLDHYDLTPNKRKQALKLGAMELTTLKAGKKIHELRLKAKDS